MRLVSQLGEKVFEARYRLVRRVAVREQPLHGVALRLAVRYRPGLRGKFAHHPLVIAFHLRRRMLHDPRSGRRGSARPNLSRRRRLGGIQILNGFSLRRRNPRATMTPFLNNGVR